MEPLFSNAGMRRLDRMCGERLLCAFDFDGTLAPIVPVPGQAHLPHAVREKLLALARYAPVAIITGRSVPDIRERLDFDADFIVGNHGLEGVPGWEEMGARHEALCHTWLLKLGDELRGAAHDPAIEVENKRYSLSVHYRRVRDVETSARRLERLFSDLTPRPRVVAGKYVFNLLAEDASNKGSALARLIDISGAHNTIYVGDDVTDEDVFRMRRRDVLSVRVEPSPDSAARFFLPHPDDILRLLDELIARLHACGARNWMPAATPDDSLSSKRTAHENT
jgi:trehalose 6-phosphate phosphatase